ncbi:pyrimidine 5 -nucleotidase [Fusarium agapanthi]|uniref:Pyrimidine 5 -nucleotidase n=1 Tax=Fusarium agapanthi TaxID=1803897 RepID=A0A9P5B825_9HYPO|nr:pyrimidine 5 -nucleotidase [Fusarium agapanthi]
MNQASEKPVLFFDIDNCLYSRNDKVLEHMSRNIDDYFKKHLGLSPDDAERLHMDYSQQYGQAIEGLVRHHQIDALEYNAKVDDAVPLDDLIKPNAQLRQFLEDIDTSKVRLWLLTNAYVNHGKRVVRLLGVDDLFEGLTYCDYSQVPFVCKPHKEMFMKAMREAGVSDVSRCHFIDDSQKNCVGAKDAGWIAIHFVEEGLPVPDTPASQHQIRHLEELRSLYPDFFRAFTLGHLTNPSSSNFNQNGAKILQYRAIWIQGNNFDDVKISGVAARDWNDRSVDSIVTVNPNARYDDRQVDDDGFPIEDDDDHEPDVQISIVNLFRPNPPPEWRWGFLFHDACWSLLNLEQKVDLGDLFRLCVSSPLGPDLLLNFGHDYGDVSERDYEGAIEVLVSHYRSAKEAEEMLRTNPLEIPALKKAITFSARMQQDAFQSILDRSNLSADKDVFNYLPPEILERIVTFLPSPDVHSLRLASRVFATLSLSERFWISRLTEGHEFDYLPEVFATPPASWRALYLSLHIWASDNMGMGNRKRVWPLVKGFHKTLRQMKDVDCLGNLINTMFEPEAPKFMPKRGSLITAERHLFAPGAHFMGGSRVLRARSAEFPQHLKVMLMSVSFVDTPDGPFISGLMFVGADGVFESLGYTHKSQMEHITLHQDQCVKGFEVALGTCGFRAIAAITQDGTTSSWAGDPADYPRRRLTDVEGISLIVARFDALKLVSLSRDRVTKELQEPRDRLLWHPEIPSPDLFLDGVRPLDEKASSKVPIMTVFFGENDGRYIRQMTSISTHIFDWCHVDRLNFEFMDDSIERCLGDVEYEIEQSDRPPIRFPDHGNSTGHFEIDGGGGEEIESFEVQFDEQIIFGLKFNLNTNRTELVSNGDKPFDVPWTKVTPRGKKIIGMFSQGAKNRWGVSFILPLFCEIWISGGQAFFISDGRPQKFFDFSRKLYAAAGYPIALEEVTKIPFFMMQALASTAEWVYWIMTLGYIKPDLVPICSLVYLVLLPFTMRLHQSLATLWVLFSLSSADPWCIDGGYTTQSNNWIVTCGYKETGGTIFDTLNQNTLTQCVSLCDSITGCASVAYDNMSGQCQLFSKTGTLQVYSGGAVVAKVVGSPTSSASSTSSSDQSSTSTSDSPSTSTSEIFSTSSSDTPSSSTPSARSTSSSAAACPTSYYTGSQNTWEILCDHTVAGDNFAAQTPTFNVGDCAALCDSTLGYLHRVSIFVIILDGININNNLDVFKFSVIGSSNINILNNFHIFNILFNLEVIRKSNIDLFNLFFNNLFHNLFNSFFNILNLLNNFNVFSIFFNLRVIRNSNINVFNIFFNIFRTTNNLHIIRIVNNPDVFTFNILDNLNLSIIRKSNINISSNFIFIYFYFFGILNVLDTLRIVIINNILNNVDIFNTINVINGAVGIGNFNIPQLSIRSISNIRAYNIHNIYLTYLTYNIHNTALHNGIYISHIYCTIKTSTPSNPATTSIQSSTSFTLSSTITSSTSSSPGTPSNAPIVKGYAYDGCLGSRDNYPSFTLVATESDMTVKRCIEMSAESRYVGLYEQSCYRADSINGTEFVSNCFFVIFVILFFPFFLFTFFFTSHIFFVYYPYFLLVSKFPLFLLFIYKSRYININGKFFAKACGLHGENTVTLTVPKAACQSTGYPLAQLPPGWIGGYETDSNGNRYVVAKPTPGLQKDFQPYFSIPVEGSRVSPPPNQATGKPSIPNESSTEPSNNNQPPSAKDEGSHQDIPGSQHGTPPEHGIPLNASHPEAPEGNQQGSDSSSGSESQTLTTPAPQPDMLMNSSGSYQGPGKRPGSEASNGSGHGEPDNSQKDSENLTDSEKEILTMSTSEPDMGFGTEVYENSGISEVNPVFTVHSHNPRRCHLVYNQSFGFSTDRLFRQARWKTIQKYPYDRQHQHMVSLKDPAQHGTHYREARQFDTCYALPIMNLMENPRVLGLTREGLSDQALTATLPHRLLMAALNKITQDAFARVSFPSFPGNGCNWNCHLQEGRKERRQWTQYRLRTSGGRDMSIFRCQSHVARLDYGRHYTLGMLLTFMATIRNQDGKMQISGVFLRSYLDNLPGISLGVPLIVSVEMMEDGKPHADPWFRHPLPCVEWMDRDTNKWYKAVVSHKDLLFPIEGEPATVSAAWRKATTIAQFFKNRRYSNPPPYPLETMRPNIRTLNYDHMKQVISFSQVQEQPARPPPAQVSFMDNYREMLRAIQTQWPQATLGRKPQIKFFGTNDSACANCRVRMIFFSKDIGGCAKREEFLVAEGEDEADKIRIGSCKVCWKYWRRPCIWVPLSLGRVPGEPVDKRRPVYPPEYRGMVPAYNKDPIPVEIRAPMSMEDYYNLLNDDQENGGEQEDAMVDGD